MYDKDKNLKYKQVRSKNEDQIYIDLYPEAKHKNIEDFP